MILYLSGNFPQFRQAGKEAKFRDDLHADGKPYNRLCTFFYPKDCDTIFNILDPDRVPVVECSSVVEQVAENTGCKQADTLPDIVSTAEINEFTSIRKVKQTTLF
jgi:hypothetical protein